MERQENGKHGKEHLKEKNVKELLADTANQTSMHGLPRVYNERSKVRRIIWIIILLFGVCLMIWQVSIAFKKYFSYPSDTKISLYSPNTALLPAITICNNNPVKKSKALKHKELKKLIDEVARISEPFSRVEVNTSDPESSPNYYSEFMHLLHKCSLEESGSMGHQLEDMLLDCWLAPYGYCSTSDFTTFTDPAYGNCFTINTFNDTHQDDQLDWRRLVHVHNEGIWDALSLSLYIEEDEYTFFAEGSGISLVVHNQTTMPFPQIGGIIASPGQLVYLGLKRREIYRAKPPHGECADYEGIENVKRNMYVGKRNYLTYSREACVKTCYQRHILERCNCLDPLMPSSPATFSHLLKGDKEPEYCTNKEQLECEDEVAGDISGSDDMQCAAECPHPCTEIMHDMTVSYGTWPNKENEDGYIQMMVQKSQKLNDTLRPMTREQQLEFLRRNFVNIKIFFDDRTVTTTRTSPSYTSTDLLGALGGLIGLYLGLSVLTIFEFLELFWDITYLYCRPKKGPGGAKSNAKDQEGEAGLNMMQADGERQ